MEQCSFAFNKYILERLNGNALEIRLWFFYAASKRLLVHCSVFRLCVCVCLVRVCLTAIGQDLFNFWYEDMHSHSLPHNDDDDDGEEQPATLDSRLLV